MGYLESEDKIFHENFFADSNFSCAKDPISGWINFWVDVESRLLDEPLRLSCLREKKLHIEHEVGISELDIVSDWLANGWNLFIHPRLMHESWIQWLHYSNLRQSLILNLVTVVFWIPSTQIPDYFPKKKMDLTYFFVKNPNSRPFFREWRYKIWPGI